MDFEVPSSQAGCLAAVFYWCAHDEPCCIDPVNGLILLKTDSETSLYARALKAIGVTATIVVHDS